MPYIIRDCHDKTAILDLPRPQAKRSRGVPDILIKRKFRNVDCFTYTQTRIGKHIRACVCVCVWGAVSILTITRIFRILCRRNRDKIARRPKVSCILDVTRARARWKSATTAGALVVSSPLLLWQRGQIDKSLYSCHTHARARVNMKIDIRLG